MSTSTAATSIDAASAASASSSSSSASASATGDELRRTWRDFVRALHSVEQFDQWHWIRLLTVASFRHASQSLQSRIPALAGLWGKIKTCQHLIPLFSFVLVLAVLGLYFWGGLHEHVVVRRWCPPCNCTIDGGITSAAESSVDGGGRDEPCGDVVDGCAWSRIHVAIVLYFCVMILWNYCRTVFDSPGVALPSAFKANAATDTATTVSNAGETCETTCGDGNGAANDEDEGCDGSVEVVIRWRSLDRRGGFCFIDPPAVDVTRERARVASYQRRRVGSSTGSGSPSVSDCGGGDGRSLTTPKKKKGKGDSSPTSERDGGGEPAVSHYYPSPEPSYCDKCRINRPPRCHHCSACDRCILQMDHHCPWMNTCIGLANYRTFVLTLFYLVVGCAYGVCMLFNPFVDLVAAQARRDGIGSVLASVRVPPVWTLARQLWRDGDGAGGGGGGGGGRMDPDDVVRITFPFLVGVGLTMAVFLVMHARLIVGATTTLEQVVGMKKSGGVRAQVENACPWLRNKGSVIGGSRSGRRRREDDAPRSRAAGGGSRGDPVSTDAAAHAPLTTNPFDQGWRANLTQVLGPNWMLALLPITVESPDPYVPDLRTKKSN